MKTWQKAFRRRLALNTPRMGAGLSLTKRPFALLKDATETRHPAVLRWPLRPATTELRGGTTLPVIPPTCQTGRGMDRLSYLRIQVNHRDGGAGTSNPRTAILLVYDADVFTALQLAVSVLHRSGWTMENLEEFRTNVPPGDLLAFPDATELYEEATKAGIAWCIGGQGETAAGDR